MRHEQQQAYYTALSSTQTVADWIMGNGLTSGSVAYNLLAQVASAGSEGITVDEGIPQEAGEECRVNLSYTNEEKTLLKISSTATFAGMSETVSLTIENIASPLSSYEDELEVGDYSTVEDKTRADELNALATGGIVALYESSSVNDKDSTFNAKDVTLLDSYISATSNREARWTNVDLTSSSSSHNVGVLGTQRYTINLSAGATKADTRRFMVPANGRITIDPLESDGKGDATASSAANNTMITSLAIDNTAGKNVLFRLASGSAALEGGLLNKTAKETFQNRSVKRYASLVTLNFTDNAGSTENLSYEINGASKTYTWHPNKWEKLDLFVQARGEVTSNLAFGAFAHKYDSYLDYWSWGDFVDNWNGTKAGESDDLWGYGGSDAGIPIFPVNFGKNANFWILDGRGGNYVWFMQGANVLDGTIYSTRSTVFGGALVRASSTDGKTMYPDYTSDGLNRDVWGYVNDNPKTHIQYVETTTRFSQLIYNTDIILMPPSSGTAYSAIRRPNTWQDRANTAYITTQDKTFNPTVTIKGGTIYVGERQSLTIQGTVKDSAGTILDNMWIAPDKIIVAKGGALTLKTSQSINVFTDIYVDGGTLTIESAAKMKGNIYAYNGGTVDMQNTFQLHSSSSDIAVQEHDGMFIYGEDTVGTVIGGVEITSPGKLIVKSTLPQINGNSGRGGKAHLIGGDWADLVTGTSVSLTSAEAKAFLCKGYDEATGRCPHFTGTSGSTGTGSSGGGSSGGGSSGGVSSGSGSGGGSSGSGGGSSGGDASLPPNSAEGRGGGGWLVGSFGRG
jgi:hypothetical protein